MFMITICFCLFAKLLLPLGRGIVTNSIYLWQVNNAGPIASLLWHQPFLSSIVGPLEPHSPLQEENYTYT